ncbi:hypothetical protein CU097_014521 [Rhizopus azygosporus]|uniref:Uncharacterized protein n=1 Tax=Rhizopus azygosporus TaxID=86630 RepID=A0A367KF56_RHIAZ|nr:hypothetical protein CU097_014521 [Rhizopus azygosporus]
MCLKVTLVVVVVAVSYYDYTSAAVLIQLLGQSLDKIQGFLRGLHIVAGFGDDGVCLVEATINSISASSSGKSNMSFSFSSTAKSLQELEEDDKEDCTTGGEESYGGEGRFALGVSGFNTRALRE